MTACNNTTKISSFFINVLPVEESLRKKCLAASIKRDSRNFNQTDRDPPSQITLTSDLIINKSHINTSYDDVIWCWDSAGSSIVNKNVQTMRNLRWSQQLTTILWPFAPWMHPVMFVYKKAVYSKTVVDFWSMWIHNLLFIDSTQWQSLCWTECLLFQNCYETTAASATHSQAEETSTSSHHSYLMCRGLNCSWPLSLSCWLVWVFCFLCVLVVIIFHEAVQCAVFLWSKCQYNEPVIYFMF